MYICDNSPLPHNTHILRHYVCSLSLVHTHTHPMTLCLLFLSLLCAYTHSMTLCLLSLSLTHTQTSYDSDWSVSFAHTHIHTHTLPMTLCLLYLYLTHTHTHKVALSDSMTGRPFHVRLRILNTIQQADLPSKTSETQHHAHSYRAFSNNILSCTPWVCVCDRARLCKYRVH